MQMDKTVCLHNIKDLVWKPSYDRAIVEQGTESSQSAGVFVWLQLHRGTEIQI